MKDGLLSKIDQVLSQPITEEMQVVYLLVEIRKLMDRTNYQDTVLRTFCNWVAHIELEQKKEGSTIILREIENLVMRSEEGRELPNPLQLVSACGFRKALERICTEHGLPTELTTQQERWSLFTKLYSSVVAECPITYKASREELKYVKKLELQPVTQGSAMAWRVTLKDDRITNWLILLDK
jgi:hypothetical protein